MTGGGGIAPEVVPLDDADAPDAVEALARAFRDNPLNVAVLGKAGPERRLRSNRLGSGVLVESARLHAEVWTVRRGGGVVGALVGVPPGAYPLPPPPLRQRLAGLWVQGWRASRRWAEVFERLDALHPVEPHWYLGTLGIDPDGQGAGLGSALLRRWLRHTEPDGTTVYLETDRERNVGFYRREGFTVLRSTEVLGVPVWCMQRPAPPG